MNDNIGKSTSLTSDDKKIFLQSAKGITTKKGIPLPGFEVESNIKSQSTSNKMEMEMQKSPGKSISN